MTVAAFTPNPAAVTGTSPAIADSGVNFAMLDNATTPYSGTVGARFTLGMAERDKGGNLYRYVQFQSAATAGDIVVTDETYLAVQMTNGATAGKFGREIGIALVTVPADVSSTNGYFGWVLIEGLGNVNAATSATANAVLASTTTAGQIGSSVAAGTKNLGNIVLTQAGQASPALTTCRIGSRVTVGTTN